MGKSSPDDGIFLLVYLYPFDKSPSLQNLARDLTRKHPTVVLVDHRFASNLPADMEACSKSPAATSNRVNAGRTYERGRFETFVRTRLPAALRRWMRDIYIAQQLLIPLPRFCIWVRRQARSGTLIAADKPSLLASLLAGRIPGIYYSLEATPLREEDSYTYKLLNVLETAYVRLARPWVICQSRSRADLIQPDRSRQIIIPVTSDGQSFPRSRFLRDHFSIGPDKKILLIAGGLGSDQMTLEILGQVGGWDPSYVLVLHSASGKYAEEVLAAAQSDANAGRVLLTEFNFSIEMAEELIYASADVGIVYYRDLGFNHRHTAYSSGKLAAFMRAGVPVIVPEFDEFEAALRQFRFGEPASIEAMGSKVAVILERYADYSGQASAAFEQIYSYKNHAMKISQVITEGR
jgi:hypothetical protein